MAIIVDEPLINSPLAEPTRHHRMRGGRAELLDARRPSGFTPGLRTRGGQGTLLEEEYVELPVVNDIRERVRRWREAGYPGATRTTLDLLRHWQKNRGRSRPGVCQCRSRSSVPCSSASWRRRRRRSG